MPIQTEPGMMAAGTWTMCKLCAPIFYVERKINHMAQIEAIESH